MTNMNPEISTNLFPQIGMDSELNLRHRIHTTEQHPLIARHVIITQQPGAKLIVADPRLTETKPRAASQPESIDKAGWWFDSPT